MEISDLKSDETHLTRICGIKNFVRSFKWDTMYSSGSKGCKTAQGQSWR